MFGGSGPVGRTGLRQGRNVPARQEVQLRADRRPQGLGLQGSRRQGRRGECRRRRTRSDAPGPGSRGTAEQDSRDAGAKQRFGGTGRRGAENGGARNAGRCRARGTACPRIGIAFVSARARHREPEPVPAAGCREAGNGAACCEHTSAVEVRAPFDACADAEVTDCADTGRRRAGPFAATGCCVGTAAAFDPTSGSASAANARGSELCAVERGTDRAKFCASRCRRHRRCAGSAFSTRASRGIVASP